jgi:uncharacterized protein YpiB (UPF0302 family)
MVTKQQAILQFSRSPLKHPHSKFLLQTLGESRQLLNRLTFVRNRDFLPHTMLISELGSPRVGFELELGVRQREEVSIVNGQLVRHTRRECVRRIHEPLDAIEVLHEVSGQLYVVFSFCGPIPSWYERVAEPHPVMPTHPPEREILERVLAEILRDQVDLAVLAIFTREAIDRALDERDISAFRKHAAVYREVMQRRLWEP